MSISSAVFHRFLQGSWLVVVPSVGKLWRSRELDAVSNSRSL